MIIGEARKAVEEQARIARSAEEDQRQEMIRAKTEAARRAEAEEALRRKVAEL